MANSSCLRCNSSKFEIKSGQITNPNSAMPVRIFFVQCANCGGVISVLMNDPFKANEEIVETNDNAVNPHQA